MRTVVCPNHPDADDDDDDDGLGTPGVECRWKAKSSIAKHYNYCPMCGAELP